METSMWLLATVAANAADLTMGETNSLFGDAVVFADLDGDGLDELVVGAPWSSAPELQEGRVYVWRGGTFPPSGAPDWTLERNEAGASFGESMAAGDVDGDGIEDLVVGSPQSGTAPGHDFDGAVALYLGSATGPGAVPAWTASGSQDGSFGLRIALGDVDGDGFDDVVVAGPVETSNSGAVYLFRGSANGPSAAPDWTVTAPIGTSSYLGTALAVGDLDGDGYADVAAGSVNYSAVYVWYGSAAGLGAGPGWSASVQVAPGRKSLGVAVAIGDADGDGYADLAVGSPLADQGGPFREGRTFLYRGSAVGLGAAAAWTADGGAYGVGLGHDLAFGDADGDGDDDLMVHDLGDVVKQPGRVSAWLGVPGGLSARPVVRFTGSELYAEFGEAIAAGDIDGDGSDEIAVAAPSVDGATTNEGVVTIVPGH